jgi:hypothetical protein
MDVMVLLNNWVYILLNNWMLIVSMLDRIHIYTFLIRRINSYELCLFFTCYQNCIGFVYTFLLFFFVDYYYYY